MSADAYLVKRARDVYDRATYRVFECEFDADFLGEDLVIVIRGTEISGTPSDGFWGKVKNLWDVVRDLRILPWPVKIDHMEVFGHAGFVKGASKIFDVVGPLAMRHKPAKVYVTGHSLGAAEAQVVGLMLASDGHDVEVVGFGSPRIFFTDIEIPENCSIKLYRYGKDLVTHVPYGRHLVEPINIGKPYSWFWNIHDHDIEKYCDFIIHREISL